jgi:hypothetical protein
MPLRIKQDQARFRDIVRGRIKANLKRYVQQGEMIGRKGKDLISIPIPSIDLPHFRFSDRSQGGVGQGEGKPGDPLGNQPGTGPGAGSAEGEHILEVDVTLDELADLLGEELALPRIKPRGAERIVTTRTRYTGISPTGPESLRHVRRTYKEALRRQIASGVYDPSRPVIVPVREDRRYLTWKEVPRPETNAAILYLMDVSGSMGDEQKELVRLTSFWIDAWLRRHYKGLVTRYLIHDVSAKEVDRETFFHTRESGGTRISSAYELALQVVERDYPSDGWNVYAFHFSDGDNEGSEDTRRCVELLKGKLLPALNLFGYGQVYSPSGSGAHLDELQSGLGTREDVVLAKIPDRAGIHGCIKAFLGTGR